MKNSNNLIKWRFLLLLVLAQVGITIRAANVSVYTQETVQQITGWGHDIKNSYTAYNLINEACQQIFRDGRFNILRIPIYCNAHNADGTFRDNYNVDLEPKTSTGGWVQWKQVPTDGEWFHLESKAHGTYLKGWDDNDAELAATSNTGHWTQWRLVDAGNGWSFLENRGHSKYLWSGGFAVELNEKTSDGSWSQWKLTDAGDGWLFIENNGHNKYLQGGGTEYDKIIEAINRVKNNGNADLYASVKIYWPADQSLSRNDTWGPFLKSDGLIHATNYAACIDNYIDFFQAKTGQTVKYVAPICEQSGPVPTYKFKQIVERMNHQPLIIGPEHWGVRGSEEYWDANLAAVVDLTATHNKDHNWVTGAKYDWNGETKGGSGDEFINLIKELNQSVYEGEVNTIVWWADQHLLNTNDGGNNGPFRRSLIAASEFNPVRCNVAARNSAGVVMAFETANTNEYKVFYAGTESVTINFDIKIEPSSIPASATAISDQSFTMPATGKQSYGEFTVAKYINITPTANAGVNQTVVDTDNSGAETVTLDGSGSSDTDGTITGYEWFEGGALIATGVSPSLILNVGTHNLSLTVTDNEGATDSDNVIITVEEGAVPARTVFISNKKTGHKIRPRSSEGNAVVQAPADWTGSWVQWELTATNGDYFTLKCLGNNTYLSMPTTADADVVYSVDAQTTKEEWKIVDMGDGYFLLENRASGKRIRARTTDDFSTVPNGNYYIEVSKLAWTGDWVRWQFTDVPKSAKQEESFAFKLYPNPASEQITITLNEVNENTTIELLNTSGQVLKSQTVRRLINTVDIAALPQGMYILKLSNQNNISTKIISVK